MKSNPPQSEDELEKILHDFAVGLHEYANGRANGLVYGEEITKARSALQAHTTKAILTELKKLLAHGSGGGNWRRMIVQRIDELEKFSSNFQASLLESNDSLKNIAEEVRKARLDEITNLLKDAKLVAHRCCGVHLLAVKRKQELESKKPSIDLLAGLLLCIGLDISTL